MNMDQEVTAGGNGKAEAGFDLIFDGYDQGRLLDATETEDAIPAGTYVLEFAGGVGQLTKDESIPQLRMNAKVIEGQDTPNGSTVGRRVFGILKYGVSRFEYGQNENGVRVKKEVPAEDFAKTSKEYVDTLHRVAYVFGLLTPLPKRDSDGRPSVQTLTEHGVQFAGKQIVIEVGQLPGDAEQGFGARNFFRWKSARRLDETVKTAKGEVAGTAHDYARKKIAAANLKLARKTAGSATTPTTAPPAVNSREFA